MRKKASLVRSGVLVQLLLLLLLLRGVAPTILASCQLSNLLLLPLLLFLLLCSRLVSDL